MKHLSVPVSDEFDETKSSSVTMSHGTVEWIETRDAAAAYPGLTFLKVLFGQHSFSDLRSMYPDCSSKNFAMMKMQDVLFGGPLNSSILTAN